jgi:septal ring factor EnvC (AmiA/AmiB activator)
MEAVQQVISDIGIIGLIGALIWLIRLEGVVKRNTEEIKRLGRIEEQTQEQEVRIKQRDEEMRAIKFSLDELKERVSKVETNQVNTGETLVRIETKLDIMMKKYEAS